MAAQAGKYARFELERRFLAAALPDGLDRDRGWRITDRYIEGTSTRLRRLEPLAGGETLFKLGRKEVPLPPDYSRMTITNIYLPAGEYGVFAALPARELRKTRHPLTEGGHTYGVDVFDGALAGLVLAEVEFATSARMDEQWRLPHWVLREVSDDVRFTGGALAGLAAAEAASFLRQLSAKR